MAPYTYRNAAFFGALKGASIMADDYRRKKGRTKSERDLRERREKRGRPTNYSARLGAAYELLRRHNWKDAEAAEVFGVGERTLELWASKHEEFMRAVKAGKKSRVELLEAALLSNATGGVYMEEKVFVTKWGGVLRVPVAKMEKPDTAAVIFALKSLAPDKYRDTQRVEHVNAPPAKDASPVDYETFVKRAGYPEPYVEQIAMKDFICQPDGQAPRLLLGAPGYGKTDYTTILGVAYLVYCDSFNAVPSFSSLIITKSGGRNAAIMGEIEKACLDNGVVFAKANSKELRVQGLHGKDGSVEMLTVLSTSLRGRHPKLIILDDPVTDQDTSAATRKRVEKTYNECWKRTKNIGVIGQPAHHDDLYAKLRELVEKQLYPWGSIPDLDADLTAAKAAGVDEKSIQASYHLKTLTDDSAPFVDMKFVEAFPKGESIAFVDPASKGGAKRDGTAMSIIRGHFDGIAVQGKLWKKSWNAAVDEIVAACKDFGVIQLYFECNSLGETPIDILRVALKEAGVKCGVVGVDSTTNKHGRIMAAGAYADGIFFSKTSDAEYLKETKNYEFGVEHDDSPDSLAGAMKQAGLVKDKLKK